MTIIAGSSTILGVIPCYFKEKNKDIIISSSLAFSSGIMLTISLFSLIPSAYKELLIQNKNLKLIITISIILIGIIISKTIDKEIDKLYRKNSLYKLGLSSAVILMLHNIPEGATSFLSTVANKDLGISIALAIALHNIPEGISVAVPIYFSTKSKAKAFIYTAISGFAEIIGAIITYIFFKDNISNTILSILLLVTSGIMIDISLNEFLPNSLKYKNKNLTAICFILGIIIMYISELFLK